jgi:hypothetical protein
MLEMNFAENVKIEHHYTDTDSKREWKKPNYWREFTGFVDVRDEFANVFLVWTPLHCRYLNNSGFYEVEGMGFSEVWKLLGGMK